MAHESILMKTVVIVTDIAFWDNTYGSHSRIQGLARFLTKEHRLIVFYLKSLDARSQEGFASLGLPRAQIVSYKSYSGRKLAFDKRLINLPFYKGKAVEDYCSSLRAFLDETRVDAVLFEYIRLAYMTDACLPGVATILDAHDVMSERTVSLRRAGLTASIEIDASLERLILCQIDRVLSISRRDHAYLNETFGLENSLYVPSTVPRVHRHKVSNNGKRLIFLGANSQPNILGLRWFLDQVWPMLVPDGFALDVVGAVGQNFKDPIPGVRVLGQSDDLAPCYAAADIAVNPVFVGGGLKIKCIDALAHGLPCVTTAEGAAGLDGAIGAGLVVADSRLAFSRAIRHFARSAADRRIAAFLGPSFIEREFLDGVAYKALEDFLAGLARPPAVNSGEHITAKSAQ